MKPNKTIIWTVAVMTFFAVAAAPAAEAFVYPMVAVMGLAAIFGTGGLLAERIIEENEQAAEKENRSQDPRSAPATADAAPDVIR